MPIFKWFRSQNEKAGSERRTEKQVIASTKKEFHVLWEGQGYPMKAVGESHYQNQLESICGGHNRHGQDHRTEAILKREPYNPYDQNAVAVKIEGKTIAYLSREHAKRVSWQMDEYGLSLAICGAKIVGGWRTNQHDEGYFGVRLAVSERGQIKFVKKK